MRERWRRTRLGARGVLGGAGRLHLGGCAVKRVAHDRVADRRHVYAYLMGTAALDADLHQRELAPASSEAFLHLPVTDGRAATRAAHGHAGAANGIAADRRVD